MFTDRLYVNPNQIEMEFLWPHRGIQLSLDLDRPETPETSNTDDTVSYSFLTGYRSEWGTTTISPSLSVSPSNSVGELKIGVINIGIEKKPSVLQILQKVLYKLLGFKWSEK
jgi:hypothetical protein